MKFVAAAAVFFALSGSIFAQVCPVSVTSAGVKVGAHQSPEVRVRNTAALNELFASINRGAGSCHHVEFPEGIVEISSALYVFNGASRPAPIPSPSGAYGAISISGVNREHSIIMQTAPNQPVFRWNSNNLYVTGIFVHDLALDNLNVEAPYNSRQWGMEFRCTTDGTGGNSWGFANSQFERLSISHMYVGLGLYTARDGACSIWSTHFQDLKFYNSQRNAIYLVGGSIGQPANTLTRIDILQENHPPSNVAVKGDSVDSAALMAIGTGGLLIDSLDIEGWNSPSAELEIYGGNATVINNLRVEHAYYTGCNPTIGYFDGDITLNGTSISWDKFSNSCLAYVFSLGGGSASLTVNGLNLASTSGKSSQPLTLWRVDDPKTHARIFANSLNLNNLASEWLPATDDASAVALYSRHHIEYLPPQVDKLPQAGADYVGRSFLLITDKNAIVYWCIRRAGTYEWVSR